MKMEKILLLFIIAFLCSCSNDEENMSIPSTEEEHITFENPFNCIGYLHNEAMDSIKEHKIQDADIETFTTAFVSRHEEKVFYIRPSIPDHEIEEMLYKAREISNLYKDAPTTRAANEINDSVLNMVPIDLRHYVYDIFEMLDVNYNDTTQINKDFAGLDYYIFNDYTLDNEEKGALLGISAIAKATLKYNMDVVTTRAANVRSTVKADAAGAVAGVFSFAFWGKAATGLVFGPGGVVLSCARELAIGAIVSSGVHVASGGIL